MTCCERLWKNLAFLRWKRRFKSIKNGFLSQLDFLFPPLLLAFFKTMSIGGIDVFST